MLFLPSERRSSPCGWPASWCAGSGSRGPAASSPTRPPPPPSPGARPTAGTRRSFRVYYLAGGLLTAPLLGAGSLLLTGRRWVAPVALVYTGLAVGVVAGDAGARELHRRAACRPRASTSAGCRRPSRSAATRSGTLALVGVALLTIRRRPLGNVLLLAGIAVAALGSGLAGSSVVTLAASTR